MDTVAHPPLLNPLSVPLVDVLRELRVQQDRLAWCALAVKAAVELLHRQDKELHKLRRQNWDLIEELRGYRQGVA